jgi:V/A-type H+-transporting ATPase subunit I
MWGLYTLYGGTSFLGVVLSYIRLMALGMVTAGIAMAINTIAWMVIKIPIVGIILALIILIFGHAYNIAINILGAFVHSLRLNYVEFFPRFFTGGGEKFSPFQRETKYVTIK